MAALPTGTVTYLLTDVEGSTRLWEAHPEAMRQALAQHDAIVEFLTAQHHGQVVRPRGEGDSRFCVFARASDGVAAAAAIQLALHQESWAIPTALRVRMALHTGEADLRDDDYYGSAVNRCARLRALAHGGQTLVSQATRDLVRDAPPAGIGFRDLGEHRLRDLTAPERLYQLLHPGLTDTFPPLLSLDTLPNNLPLQITSFVGREEELTEIERLVTSSRLVTLTGAGGAGKTRLALQTAADLAHEFPDGAWFVDLAPLADPALIGPAALDALGVREAPGQAAQETLLDYLRARHLLVVLDNCEHVVDAAARLTDVLVRRCPDLRILATSREMLGVAGEAAWRVPSLAVPDPDRPGTPEEVGTYPAVRLFLERARLVRPDLTLNDANAPAIARICARLDGIPLALELAAARAAVLSPEQIADRLRDRFRLLTGGSRTALRRQQTLQALVDWSYDLLDERERAVFRRLAVFVGGWTLEAAEAVCGTALGSPTDSEGQRVAIDPGEVLDLLASLVQKSLVTVEGAGDSSRYRMLETMRQYAEEKLLQSGEAEPVRNRHRAWIVTMTTALERERDWPRRLAMRDRLLDEDANVRAALEWSRVEDPAIGLRLAADIALAWQTRGRSAEGARWLDDMLALAPAPTPDRAVALDRAGRLHREMGEIDLALPLLQDAERLYNDLGLRSEGESVLVNLAFCAVARGDLAAGMTMFEEALARCRAIGDTAGVRDRLRDIGVIAMGTGDYATARAFLTESAEIARATGTIVGRGTALARLGIIARLEGDLAAARALGEESVTLIDRVGFAFGLAVAHGALATLDWIEGRTAEAYNHVRLMLEGARDGGYDATTPFTLAQAGLLAAWAGDHRGAVRLFGAVTPEGRAAMRMHTGDVERDVVAACEAARAAIGEAAFAAAWAEGEAMGRAQALELALRLID